MSASRFFLFAVVERETAVLQVVRCIVDWRRLLQYRDACVRVCVRARARCVCVCVCVRACVRACRVAQSV